MGSLSYFAYNVYTSVSYKFMLFIRCVFRTFLKMFVMVSCYIPEYVSRIWRCGTLVVVFIISLPGGILNLTFWFLDFDIMTWCLLQRSIILY